MERPVHVSILVSTRNRATLLPAFLQGLDAVLDGEPLAEALLIDNGSSDDSANVLACWVQNRARRRWLSVPSPGKSAALNRALRLATGEIVAFTDDDVVLPELWAKRIREFLHRHPQFGAVAGRIALASGAESVAEPIPDPDPWLLTLPLLDFGDEVREVPYFYGANFAVRAELLAKVGGFCERLGPGASGFYDDIELAQRLRAAGVRIGYDPENVVYHRLDAGRMTKEELWRRAQGFARSESTAFGARSPLTSLLRCTAASFSLGAAWIVRNRHRFLRARFRQYRHLAHLQLWLENRHRGDTEGFQAAGDSSRGDRGREAKE